MSLLAAALLAGRRDAVGFSGVEKPLTTFGRYCMR